jgi:hypothetical protein
VELGNLFASPEPIAYNPSLPDRDLRHHRHRRVPPLDLQPVAQVLEYFDAYLIGLTATPSKQTFGFFNQNLVMEYSPPAGRGRRRERQLRRLPHPHRVTEQGSRRGRLLVQATATASRARRAGRSWTRT